MSVTAMNADEVMMRAADCINEIKNSRAKSDRHILNLEVSKRRKRNKFWNKVTFGLVTLASDSQLEKDADAYLSCDTFLSDYPDWSTSGAWEQRAKRLIMLARENPTGTIYVDDQDIVVMRWCR